AQSYSNWQLILVDASNDENRQKEIQMVSQHDTRIQYIKVENKGIAANTNAGIAIATGDYICFSDHDDVLDPHALRENAKVIAERSPDIIYSDEDKISDDGTRYFEPHFKPDFSIDLLHSVNYITHFVCVRASLVKKIKGI